MKFSFPFDPFLLVPFLGLSVMSLFVIGGIAPDSFWQHVLSFAVGIVFFFVFSLIDVRVYPRLVWFLYVGVLLSLSLTWFGPNVRGATRWVDIGFLRIQPSEIIKPFVILFLSWVYSRPHAGLFSSFGISFFSLLPILLIIFHQPDLGNVIIYLLIFGAMVFFSGISWRVIGAFSLIFFFSIPLFLGLLKSYQRERIQVFLSPEQDPVGAGYNALQAMIAIGSGRIFGLGLGHGTQTRLKFLPEYHTDFIFASLVEELGFLGGAVVIGFCFVLLARLLILASRAPDVFGTYVIIGVFTQFFAQVFVNIGMNIGLLPITGITFPLLSYGGSSLISTCIELGLVFAVSRRIRHSPLVIGS